MKTQRTTVGMIDREVLAFTAGRDADLDDRLIRADCIGTAAHVAMLSRMKPPVVTPAECGQIIESLREIMVQAEAGRFKIKLADQDVHLAVERALTQKWGDLGKKIHTARSRNDQVAVDLRIYARDELLATLHDAAALGMALLSFGKRHERVPMVGRTHMQPGMPSSVGLWAAAHAESLLDDCALLQGALDLNDRSPLGSAAGYGVPLAIDRDLTASLLGFSRPVHTVLYAGNSRGKIESVILSAMSQVMMTLSRLAQDLMLFTMPEFGYFTLPDELCTGSSIMPQKKNPDVIELVRGRASRVKACEIAVYDLMKASPGGYNRDVQESKEPFMEGIATTRACLRVLTPFIEATRVHREKLLAGFTPDVFATDRALELVGQGMPFRDAYQHVKEHLDELEQMGPADALRKKTHQGAPMGLNWTQLRKSMAAVRKAADAERRRIDRVVHRLMGFPSARA